jgi:hypothetical protein
VGHRDLTPASQRGWRAALPLRLRAKGRVLTGVSLLAALPVAAASLAACSASPLAASVDGQAITRGQLFQELGWWASSPAYVKAYDQASYAQYQAAQSQGQQATWFKVEGDGPWPGTYGSFWVSQVLGNMVEAAAIQQDLAKHRTSPTTTQVAAAWAAGDAAQPLMWQEWPPQLRALIAERDAEHALVEKAPSTSQLSAGRKFYQAHQASFWSRICVRSVDITVTGAAGASRAARLAAHPDQITGWASDCMTPDELLSLPAAFRDEVGRLDPLKAGYVRESYGYQVVQVTSRTRIPFGPVIAQAIYLASRDEGVITSSADLPAFQDPPAVAVLKAAKVTIDPRYGSWVDLSASSYPGYPPIVLPVGLHLNSGS